MLTVTVTFIAGVLLQDIPSSDAGKSNVDYNTGIFMYLKYGLEWMNLGVLKQAFAKMRWSNSYIKSIV